MVDGNGCLKLSDFGFAKLEGEDLESIFKETFDATSAQWSQSGSSKPPKVYKKPFGELCYIAPEVLKGEENSQASDLWSLGCMMYQMYAGACPFVANDNEQLRKMIIGKEVPNPKGNKLSTKPSAEFLSLLKGLLVKDPNKRFLYISYL
jgi:serine/threonine-protein kinase ULK4